jgi:hypothetical protein
MKRGGRPAFVCGWVLAAVATIAVAPSSRADNAPAASSALTPQQTASLAALDRAFARFETLLERDDDAGHQAATRAALATLKKRRDALHGAFDQSKYDDLRTDLNLAYHRLAAWLTPPLTPPPAAPGP